MAQNPFCAFLRKGNIRSDSSAIPVLHLELSLKGYSRILVFSNTLMF